MSAKTVSVDIIPERRYNIEEVSVLTGYSTGHIRNMERGGKIPKASRNEKDWRYWTGIDVIKILNYRDEHNLSPEKKFNNR
jgi:hypothetical protein